MMPDFEPGITFRRIFYGYSLSITYSVLELNLLPKPYDTNCKSYQIQRPENHIRSDCITDCIIRELSEQCLINCLVFDKSHKKLLRKDLSKHFPGKTICDLDRMSNSVSSCIWKNKLKLDKKMQDLVSKKLSGKFFTEFTWKSSKLKTRAL